MSSMLKSSVDNLKTQLTDNVVTNLQMQIDGNKNAIKAINESSIPNLQNQITQSKTKLDTLTTATENSTDAGNIMLFGLGYNKTVKNALPCTGGAYSPTAYPTLFDRIGYTYGASASASTLSLTGAPRELVIASIVQNPSNGHIFVVGATGATAYNAYVHVYDYAGNFIRESVAGVTSRLSSKSFVITNDGLAAMVIETSSSTRQLVASNDDGATWTAITMPSVHSNTTYRTPNMIHAYACGNYIVFQCWHTTETSGTRYWYLCYITKTNFSYTRIAYHTQTASTREYAIVTTNSSYLIYHQYESSEYKLFKFATNSAVTMPQSISLQYGFGYAGVVIGNIIYVFTGNNMYKINVSNAQVTMIKTVVANGEAPSGIGSNMLETGNTIAKLGTYYIQIHQYYAPMNQQYYRSLSISSMTNGILALVDVDLPEERIHSVGVYGSYFYYFMYGGQAFRIPTNSLNFVTPKITDEYKLGYIRY